MVETQWEKAESESRVNNGISKCHRTKKRGQRARNKQITTCTILQKKKKNKCWPFFERFLMFVIHFCVGEHFTDISHATRTHVSAIKMRSATFRHRTLWCTRKSDARADYRLCELWLRIALNLIVKKWKIIFRTHATANTDTKKGTHSYRTRMQTTQHSIINNIP